MSRQRAWCRYCGEEIRWAQSVNGKNIPLNIVPNPLGRWIFDMGKVRQLWLATRTHMKVSSRNLAEMTWRVHVAPVWEHVRIGEIKPSAVQGWVSSLSCSASSVRRIHSCLAQILDIAIRDRLLVSNPARGVSLPRKAKGRQVFLTIEQVRAVADRCGERGVIVWVLATTGFGG